MAKSTKTQKELYEIIMNGMSDNAEVVAFCEKKIEQLANKSTKSDDKKSAEQRAVMDMIVAVLCGVDRMKCGEIMKSVNDANGTDFSASKINAMIAKMLPPTEKYPDRTGELVRIEDKKDVYFALADTDAE